jgi:hypothetical protein
MTRFKITIQNAGGGTVYRRGQNYVQKCSPYDPSGLAYNEIDYAQLTDVTIAGTSIKSSCRPLDNEHIRLQGGTGTVYCQTSVTGSDAFVSPITVKLGYGYRQTIEKTITIQSST